MKFHYPTILALLAPLLPAAGDSLWVEGESGRSSEVVANSWYRSVRKVDLSGGDWVASYGGRTPAKVSYEIEVPKTGDYSLWVRANPISAKLDVQLGADAAWKSVPISGDHLGSVNIASDGKPDMRFLAWTKVDAPSLSKGPLTLEFRMSSSNGNHGAIDCFCLTLDEGWKPNGIQKPGETSTWAAPKLTDENLNQWMEFISPSAKDLAWREVRWHRHLDEAAIEAKKLGRPILLWAMNGHPCGET